MQKDPYRYFRVEAGELHEALSRGVLELEKNSGDGEIVRRLLRQAHTLKGAARVVRMPAIADLAHRIEDVLAAHRADSSAVPGDSISRLLELVDGLGAQIRELGRPHEPSSPSRIEAAELDAIVEAVAEASARLAALRREQGTADEVERALETVRIRAHDLRLVPAASVFAALERSARDAAQETRKQVVFESRGGETRLDAHVLGSLQDALLQVIRNAVAHGIETSGRVILSVERRGDRVAFVCEDDGRGFDVEAIRRIAVARGRVSAADAEALTSDDAVQLLLRGGVTTSPRLTEVAGRGVGLDVVRETVQRLRGDVAVRRRPGGGTAVELCVPVTLLTVSALRMESGGLSAAVAVEQIREVVRAVRRGREPLAWNGERLPWADLSSIVSGTAGASRIAVVLEFGDRRGAIGVDGLRGVETLVVKTLPACAIDPVVVGVSFDPDGTSRLLLDAGALIAKACRVPEAAPEPSPVRRPFVLVVDDSLTTRMLERTILESAGYRVDLAASAEEGLKLAAERPHDLFLVDLEMPGMDGFDFLQSVRGDAALRNTPGVILTSRNSAEDRRRAEVAGARAYLVKNEFDQTMFLDKVRELAGGA